MNKRDTENEKDSCCVGKFMWGYCLLNSTREIFPIFCACMDKIVTSEKGYITLCVNYTWKQFYAIS